MRLCSLLYIFALFFLKAKCHKKRLWCQIDVGCLFVMPWMSNDVKEANLLCKKKRDDGILVGLSPNQSKLVPSTRLDIFEKEWDQSLLLDAYAQETEMPGLITYVWGYDQKKVPRFKSQVDCRINHNILVYIGGQIQELNCVAYENIKHLVICAFPCEKLKNLSTVGSEKECKELCQKYPPCKESTFTQTCVFDPPADKNNYCSLYFKKALEREILVAEFDEDYTYRILMGIGWTVLLLLFIIIFLLCLFYLSDKGKRNSSSTTDIVHDNTVSRALKTMMLPKERTTTEHLKEKYNEEFSNASNTSTTIKTVSALSTKSVSTAPYTKPSSPAPKTTLVNPAPKTTPVNIARNTATVISDSDTMPVISVTAISSQPKFSSLNEMSAKEEKLNSLTKSRDTTKISVKRNIGTAEKEVGEEAMKSNAEKDAEKTNLKEKSGETKNISKKKNDGKINAEKKLGKNSGEKNVFGEKDAGEDYAFKNTGVEDDKKKDISIKNGLKTDKKKERDKKDDLKTTKKKDRGKKDGLRTDKKKDRQKEGGKKGEQTTLKRKSTTKYSDDNLDRNLVRYAKKHYLIEKK